jgi:hypothetical protein
MVTMKLVLTWSWQCGTLSLSQAPQVACLSNHSLERTENIVREKNLTLAQQWSCVALVESQKTRFQETCSTQHCLRQTPKDILP